MHTLRAFAAPLLAAALLASGCGGSSTSASSPTSTTAQTASASKTAAAPSGVATVQISNYAYAPASLTVKAGSRVTFVNRDATAHTATAQGAALQFDTSSIKPGASFTVSLTQPGTYHYICLFHAFMKGTITAN